MPLDLTKPVQTRRGGKVTIFATDCSGRFQVAWTEEFNGEKQAISWTLEGYFLDSTGSDRDLINVPEKRTLDVWANVYPDDPASYWSSRDDADKGAVSTRIACVHIVKEYTVGEGL